MKAAIRPAWIVPLFASVTVAVGVRGQDEPSAPAIERSAAIEIGRRVTIRSKSLGEDRPLRISLPEHYDSSDERCCVLYLIDGNTLFVQTVGALRHLGRNDALPTIVVGIDNTKRTRDLTPPCTDPETLEQFPTGGGSAAFRRFVVDELKPYVEANYRTNGVDVLAGHSFGGLFAAETMLVEPEAFDGYLVLSPSFWWDDGSMVATFEEAELSHGMFSKFAWFAMGDEGAGMNPNFEAVTWSLRERAPSTFRWAMQRFPGHDHWSAALPGMSEGLRALFEPIRTLGGEAASFEELEAELALARTEFGDAAALTPGPVVRRARELAERGEVEAALDIVTGAARAITDEPLLVYVRAEILERAGRLGEAASVLEAALEVYSTDDRHAEALPWLRGSLERVRERLGAEPGDSPR